MIMQAILDMAGEQLDIGQKVWVDMPHMADWFPGAVMFAEVIEGHRGTGHTTRHHEPALFSTTTP